MRILLAEDDKSIREAVSKMLKAQSYAVDAVDNGLDALDYMKNTPYALSILDIMMPGIDGLEVVRLARESGVVTPVMFLTARDSVEDRVKGLYAGADDYLVKPFAMEELIARVHVIIRRPKAEDAAKDILTLSDLTVDTRKKSVSRAGREIRLTGREYAILEYLMRHQGAVLSRAQIETSVWNYDYDGASNMIDVYIRCLRKKIDDGFDKKLIHTVRYQGYQMREDA